MANLTSDRQTVFTGNVVRQERLILEATIYAGALVAKGAAARGIARGTVSATSGFLGILKQGGVTGDVVEVVTAGTFRTSVNFTVAASDVGTTVYAVNTTTVSDNPADITNSATTNMPIGKIAVVHATGALGTNDVEIAFEADARKSV